VQKKDIVGCRWSCHVTGPWIEVQL
jgi:hypothetical protein